MNCIIIIIIIIINWSEMKTCQTGYSVNQFFFLQVFGRRLEVLFFKHFC